MTNDSGDNKKLNSFINSGSEIAGGAIGAAIGFLGAGPVGAIAGGASAPLAASALRKIGQEATERLLGPREKVRVGAAVAIASARIAGRIERGKMIRTDGFFETLHAGRRNRGERSTESAARS